MEGTPISQRPFYGEFAWAYDLIITDPIQIRCDFWQEATSRRGVRPSSRVLDAGCGTGRYAIELARRGYVVLGLDASTELVSIAREKSRGTSLPVTFRVGDMLKLPTQPKYDGVLCRGVLNDLVVDADRREAFFSFARGLREDGVLILDVREWHATALKKAREPVFEKPVETTRGRLTFRSITRLDPDKRLLLVAERHIFEQEDIGTAVTEYDFVMRCWTEAELHANLTNAGFDSILYFGDYDCSQPVGSTDRIIAVASLKCSIRSAH